MNQTIYNLNLIPTGDLVLNSEAQTKSLPAAGWVSADSLSRFGDAFQLDRAPSAQELIQQLVGTVYACATLNADLVASARIRLYIASRPGDVRPATHLGVKPLSRKALNHLSSMPAASDVVSNAASVHEITRHPLLTLLKNPHDDADTPGLSGFDLRWLTQLYLESIGRAYWLIERDDLSIPSRIWLLRPHLVREVPDTTGRQLLSHYEYGSQRYAPNEIIRFHFPDPMNPYFGGYSPLQAAIEKIRISRKEDAHINALLENMGRPDAIWSPKGDSEGGGIGNAEAERLRSAFRQSFAMAGRGGLLISDVPGSLQPLQWAPQDIVEIERQKSIKTDICNVFGVPDAKLERNAANLAGAKTADYAHKVDAGVPRCRRMEDTLNARLVKMFDPTGRLFLAYDSVVPEDEVFMLEQTKAASMTGAITRNEIRASVGLDPVPWGDVPLVPNNMVEVDAVTGKPGR